MDRLFFYIEGDSHVTEATTFSYFFDRIYDRSFRSLTFVGFIKVDLFYPVEDPRLPVYKSDEEPDFEDNSRDFDNRLKIKLSPDIDNIIEKCDNSEVRIYFLRRN